MNKKIKQFSALNIHQHDSAPAPLPARGLPRFRRVAACSNAELAVSTSGISTASTYVSGDGDSLVSLGKQ
jgi:hypothetical protein